MAQKPQGSGASDGQAASARGAADTASSSKQSNSAHSSVLPRMSDPGPSHGHAAATSEPMAKSNSSGSNPPSTKDAAGSTASPYGTRSRNRNGSSRPNYAEDKDIDMEIFELYPGRADDDAKKASRPV
ncbi:hypothetical protein MAPG_01143 [Magnaporthiopsis poae ATCC 64411]|uniref:Uncharacterized protein n=1 Tax=Magnaporthiopsis poae (strain ATCC 64411 / 73-15) TaxID=644358 RepID=A0A0C4DMX6_MAGP6|nr:hypothetical protein MAPG_01143 [Magnaporthiopsis poae ATCC 64411]